ncbi:hypothetical protein D3C76_1751500 [compost metagenome]
MQVDKSGEQILPFGQAPDLMGILGRTVSGIAGSNNLLDHSVIVHAEQIILQHFDLFGRFACISRPLKHERISLHIWLSTTLYQRYRR